MEKEGVTWKILVVKICLKITRLNFICLSADIITRNWRTEEKINEAEDSFALNMQEHSQKIYLPLQDKCRRKQKRYCTVYGQWQPRADPASCLGLHVHPIVFKKIKKVVHTMFRSRNHWECHTAWPKEFLLV